MASHEQNKAAAIKKSEGKPLTQDEQRDLDRAASQAGSNGRELNRLIGGGR